MLTKLRARSRSDEAFTLVELLVVILIIGILAAIAFPAFLGQRGRAQDAEAKFAVRTAQTAAETYFTEGQSYAGLTAPRLRAIEPTLNTGVAAGNKLVVSGVSATGYTVAVASRSGTTFRIAKATNPTAKPPTVTVTRTCTVAGKYGCLTGGRW